MSIIELQERDLKILEDIKLFKTVLAEDVCKMYWNNSKNGLLCTQRRLRLLHENKKLNRWRENTTSSYYYYKGKKPIQLKHNSLIYKLYVRLATQEDIVKFYTEKEFKNNKGESLRCDLFLIVKKGTEYIPVICEVNLAHIYKDKWTYFINSGSYKKYFPIAPIILDVTRFNRSISSIPIITIRLNEIENIRI